MNVVEEITNLITAQRAYEMNSKVIETSDQMMATISNIDNGQINMQRSRIKNVLKAQLSSILTGIILFTASPVTAASLYRNIIVDSKNLKLEIFSMAPGNMPIRLLDVHQSPAGVSH